MSKFIRIFCTYFWERLCDFFAIISHLTSSSLSIFSSFRRSASNSILVIWSEKIILRGAMVHFNTSHLFVGFFQQTEPLFDLLNGLPFFQVCLYGSPSPSGQLILDLSSNKLPPTLLDDYFCSGACSLRSSLHPPPPPQSRALKTK